MQKKYPGYQKYITYRHTALNNDAIMKFDADGDDNYLNFVGSYNWSMYFADLNHIDTVYSFVILYCNNTRKLFDEKDRMRKWSTYS